MSLAQIRIFLQEVKSDLFQTALDVPFKDLVRLMQIARGAEEDLRPVNIGLLFFSEQPEKYFPYSWIGVTIFHDDIGDSFSDMAFKGPVQQQLKQALSYIKGMVIEEHVQKVDYQAEAIRFFNYPFQAVEEALANAVYHKSYEIREPIKVNVRINECIEILSHAGPVPPVSKDDFKKERIITIKYLNRRLGDLLRELHLTEGKGTGIPKIRRAMRNNGSDEAIFETDDDRSYFLTILPIHKLEAATYKGDPITHNGKAITHGGLGVSSGGSGDSSGGYCLDGLAYPIFDSLNHIDTSLQESLLQCTRPLANNKRLPKQELKNIVIELCNRRYLTLPLLSELLTRSEDYVRKDVLNPMVKDKMLFRAFPNTPNDPRQAYTSSTVISKDT